MIAPFDLTSDADAAAEGTGGVQIHVDITPAHTAPPPFDDLAATGGDLQTMLIVAGALLLVIGVGFLVRGLRRRA